LTLWPLGASRSAPSLWRFPEGQSAASGLDAFDADAGFKRVNMTAGGEWKPSEHWMLIGEAGVGRLIGNAADSPITEDKVQTSLFFGIAYLF
jgi:outer membrane scaffolding protein for murein synthesis (MipA/OmpV family)